MPKPKKDNPKGILNPDEGKQQFHLSRFMPSEDLQFFIEHFWIVEWDLGDGSYQQDILAYPSVHLAVEKGKTMIYGVVTGKFNRTIKGQGKVVGIKFRPGGFYPFYQSSVSSISDDLITVDEVFDVGSKDLENRILVSNSREKMVERAEDFIREHLPEEDERVPFINEIIDAVIADKSLIKVDQLVEQFDVSKRSLQRMFKKYVGVSPKWVIKRYRLHEVAGQLVENRDTDWAQLAVDLGYYDQSHFIKDFKSIVGQTPAEYQKEVKSTGQD
jgi:AraC-like DNA-binding protein